MWPVIGFWVWSYGSVTEINWLVPIFLLTTLMTLSVGPGQVLFSYLLGAPQDSATPVVVRWYLVTAPVYTELKNVISRVAQVKELMGERQWKVTPRGADDPFAFGEDEFGEEGRWQRHDGRIEVIVEPGIAGLSSWTLFEVDLAAAAATGGPALAWLDDALICDGTEPVVSVLAPYVPMVDTFAVEAEVE